MSKKMVDKEEAFDLFQYWLMDSPDAIERMMDRLPAEVKNQLDYSVESLDVLEAYLLNQYASIDEIKQEPPDILNGYAIYVGETFRKVAKSLTKREPNIWTIELDDTDDVFYNLPVIEIGAYINFPMGLVTASLDRRRGNYLSTILKNFLEDS
ncbi:hypothetical protein [Psychrobacter sp. I-STPA6b]|uniref:hypothetical protein n=1 Tax=Psychrobacter sp. I-STPA6b TaxID=2585718 RepID=UPI001D0C3990|nr:hypothetical protein [Psychrobacter sp. I-STPA6b]